MKRCESIHPMGNIRCGLPKDHAWPHQNFYNGGVAFWFEEGEKIELPETDWDLYNYRYKFEED